MSFTPRPTTPLARTGTMSKPRSAYIASLTSPPCSRPSPCRPAATTTRTPQAHDPAAGRPPAPPTRAEQIVVRGRADSLVGTAESASEGTVGAEQLEQRPLARPGEVLETVPGLIVTQHSGAGQGEPVLPARLQPRPRHRLRDRRRRRAGQPADPRPRPGLHRPELPDPRAGRARATSARASTTRTSATSPRRAASTSSYFDVLPQGIAQVERRHVRLLPRRARGLAASSAPGNLLYAVELYPRRRPVGAPRTTSRRCNGVLALQPRRRRAAAAALTASAYAGDWDATDQIAERARSTLTGFGRFDSLDETTGGDSQKYMLSGEWHRSERAAARARLLVYGFYYDLDLFSNFTYFLDEPASGDQFEQIDRRWVGGAKRAPHAGSASCSARAMENTLGLQVRSDSIDNGLFQTMRAPPHRQARLRRRIDTIPATTRRDDIWQLSLAPYFENQIAVGREAPQRRRRARRLLPLRRRRRSAPTNSGKAGRRDREPEGQPDLRPVGRDRALPQRRPRLPQQRRARRHRAAGLRPTRWCARTAPRSACAPRSSRACRARSAFWWLDIDSELLFVGDAGTTEASRPSRRYGVELANYYDVTDVAHARRRLLVLARALPRRRPGRATTSRARSRAWSRRASACTTSAASSARCGCATSARAR